MNFHPGVLLALRVPSHDQASIRVGLSLRLLDETRIHQLGNRRHYADFNLAVSLEMPSDPTATLKIGLNKLPTVTQSHSICPQVLLRIDILP